MVGSSEVQASKTHMKPKFPSRRHAMFWVLFGTVSLLIYRRSLGYEVPGWAVRTLALAIAVFGLYIFVNNMRDASALWRSAFEPRVKKTDEADSASTAIGKGQDDRG